MIRTDKRLRLCVALLCCNLIFIWGNSLLPGDVSGAFSDWVKALLSRLFTSTGADASDGFLLRKLAHFTEFAALGLLFGWLYGMLGRRPLWSFLSGAAAACIDETIQLFVPHRGPSIRDVCIDSSGVLTGLVLLYLGHTILRKKTKQYSLEDTQ